MARVTAARSLFGVTIGVFGKGGWLWSWLIFGAL